MKKDLDRILCVEKEYIKNAPCIPTEFTQPSHSHPYMIYVNIVNHYNLLAIVYQLQKSH